jgi:ribA/ribD-fused uncharacterized protein
MPITRFRDEHFFLSSMYPLPKGVETTDGLVVDSVEIGYQASKFTSPDAQKTVLEALDGYRAKRIAREMQNDGLELRQDWETARLEVMRWFVWQKFGRNESEAALLLGTKDQEIIEGNTWNDQYWGASPLAKEVELYEGRNNLGLLLMQGRDLLRHGIDLLADVHRDVELESGEVRLWPTN